ncbi:DoxX family protein [Nesterenkonia xinjiangensis]|uniref:DoxX-like family protein n=1 Tax=Nesterenkonia xinjiangensis TaxID=225327 RepID=A0A7Z0GM63_9MICC|nr:DoxX family protein [Nesterenkonia xinjiangensis]NYJ78540.1 hypothetical protein [Nesterenkonia xinjiangensis]
MVIESTPWWPAALLAAVVLSDVLLSLRPATFIARCLTGVNLPREWWWVLIYVKVLAVIGLVAGFWFPGVGIAANVGVIAYFIAAGVAHVKARFLESEFWINCLGMLTLSTATLILTLVL